MKRYAEYKDSGVEWIGEIPKDWDIDKIAAAYSERISKVSDRDYQPLSVTMRGILPQLETVAKTDNNDDRKLVRQGDFVINSRADRRGACGISPFDGSVSLINTVLEPLKSVNNLYYNFVFRSALFADEFFRWGSGIHDDLWSTKWARMKNILIPIPSIYRQGKIASYLDRKTSAIDTLIADKQKLIALLKEKRQAIISEAVTKGLDPSVPMKDSGVEWIGEIPATWEVKRFGTLFSFGRGLNITKADLEDEGIPCVSYGDIHSRYGFEVNPKKHHLRCANESYLQSMPEALLKYGDFVFADTSEDVGGSGNFTYLNSKETVFAGYHVVIARMTNTENPRFLAYLFDSIPWRTQIRSKVSGIKVFSITQSILRKAMIILPSIKEQESIVRFLDTKTLRIDTLICDITAQIENLKEYRQSIISEAVTGKAMIAEPPQDKRTMVFRRLVLSAYILDNICDEPTAGRVKFEKLLYLSEHCAKLPLHSDFHRHAAGPYDPKALYAIDGQLKDAKWFRRNRSKADSKAYYRLEKAGGYKQYLSANIDDEQKHIVDKIIHLFKTARTIQCEIVATLYGAWNDFLLDGVQPTNEQVVREVLTNWHESKERISREKWLTALGWMKAQGIIPTGYGASTKGRQG
ncbi:hypothetical protein FACS1894171_0700 [Clostridia bacterium]|nr:hypothetical protein FACS1894171_0700 [Clostridia bacterium]